MRKQSKNKKEKIGRSWKLTYSSFKPQQESLREALCTLGNGYFGTRGATSESSASRIHYPGTYIIGVYNKLGTHVSGKLIKNEDLVNCPNWLPITFRIGKGPWLNPASERIHKWNQELNLKAGILKRTVTFSTCDKKKTTIIEERLVHMANRHRAAIKYQIKPQNYSEKITISAGLDGSVENTGVARYRQLNSKHLKAILANSFSPNCIYLKAKTSRSKITIFESAKINIYGKGGKKVKLINKKIKKEKEKIYQEVELNVKKNQTYSIEKIVAIYSSKDKDVSNPFTRAKKSVKEAGRFKDIVKTHKKAWHPLWQKFDLGLKGSRFSQKALRLHSFHLLQTASLNTVGLDTGLPARGLHGEAYRGHIFWDEIFTTPFFDAHLPEVTQSLILYRYRRLLPAEKAAKKAGFKGAMFPWQSSSTGQEESQVIHLNPLSGKWGPDYSKLQRHISFDIAYNIWRHWGRTGDLNFMIHYGTEMLVDIAKFGSSLAKFDKKDGRFHTEGLMGPDEFHEKIPGAKKAGLRDNSYTNILIVWTILKAQRALSIIPEHQSFRIKNKLGITEKELRRWDDITKKMKVVIDKNGIISQFEGYFNLKEINWFFYRKKYKNIRRMDRILKAEGKFPDEYKVAKQADVLMIFYLLYFSEAKELFKRLGYSIDFSILKKNYNYYIKRTSHGSTLSKVVHCYLANLIDKKGEDWYWFQQVLKSDIYDTQGGTTPEGIHAGVMGGSIDMVMRGFCGVWPFENRIRINPNPPEELTKINYNFYYQGYQVFVVLENNQIKLHIKGDKSKFCFVPVEICGKLHYLSLGKTYSFYFKKKKQKFIKKKIKEIMYKKILIVDGDIADSEVLESRLKDKGYLVRRVTRAKEALQILKSEWINLIIMAVSLQGGMNGFRLFKEVKAKKYLRSIPILIYSSKGGLKDTFDELGSVDFVSKTSRIEILLNKATKHAKLNVVRF
ncbi:MAG: response regulator [Candidatus Omnitrophica bacterium]|nr:response regulator [Candidatus Omnitrophota bacterium]